MAIDWKEILGWNEDQISELRNTGFSFLREGHYQTALAYFEALIVLDPKSIYDYQTLGGLYMQLGQLEKSLETLNYALNFEPNDGLTLLNKVKALLLMNQKKEALEIAQRLTFFPNEEVSGEAYALIQAYR